MSSNTSWEDDDEDGSFGEESVLDAFDAYLPAQEAHDDDAQWDAASPQEGDDDEDLTVLFTASNPAETVTVTALMGGQVAKIELSAQVTKMTEAELAKEITVIATLARRQALAAQHVIIADLMRQLGHDQTSTRSLLEHEFGLPSPDTVKAERTRLFATRYSSNHD
jgi:hypothetical protein